MTSSEAPPPFFIPNTPDNQAEEVLTELAKWCGIEPPAPEDRVYEIYWTHDGDEWTAVVGRQLRGTRTRRRRRKGGTVDVTQSLSDAATVLAILPGNPYFVITDARPIGHAVSAWANPFMAGRPNAVRRFAR